MRACNPSRSIFSTRASNAGRRSEATPMAGLLTTAAATRCGHSAAVCRAMAPPTATPASDLAGNAERVQQRNQVVDHAVDGERRTYFLRQSSAAGVVTQHAALRGKHGRDQVPALDRSTHFVD